MTEEPPSASGIDPNVPSVARMYDYYLGGKDNYAADREAGDRVVAAVPYVLEFTRANRRFLSQAVTMLAERGIRQFLDIGSGLPTQENTHQAAQRVAPDARVVYVDNDPIVLAHGRALLADSPHSTVLQADLLEPEKILEHPEVRARFDFSEPIAVLLLAILHFVPDDADPAGLVDKLRAPLAPGSHLVISHGYLGGADAATATTAQGEYDRTSAGGLILRPPEEILRYFAGTDVLPPGLVPVGDWQPGAASFEPDLGKSGFLGGVGRIG